MNRTHLRFLTLKIVRKLVEDAGFCIEKVECSPWIPLFRLRKYQAWAKVEYGLARLRPTLLASQLIMKARKEQ
jgi:hypothetical protein